MIQSIQGICYHWSASESTSWKVWNGLIKILLFVRDSGLPWVFKNFSSFYLQRFRVHFFTRRERRQNFCTKLLLATSARTFSCTELIHYLWHKLHSFVYRNAYRTNLPTDSGVRIKAVCCFQMTWQFRNWLLEYLIPVLDFQVLL